MSSFRVEAGVADDVAPAPPGAGERVFALALAAAVTFYPVRAFVTLEGMPLWVRLAWPAALLLALRAPIASLLLFVAAAPVLEIVPARMGWPPASLGEMWLLALIVGAWLEIAAGKGRFGSPAVPAAVPILVSLATASMLTAMYPFHLAAGGLAPLAATLSRFLAGDYILIRGPGYIYAAIVSWMILWQGLALLWLALKRGASGRPGLARELVLAAAAGCLAVVGYGFWMAARHPVPLYEWVYLDAVHFRIRSTFADAIALGSYYALMLWVYVGLARAASSGGRRWAFRAGCAAIALGIFFTVSRASWFATLLAAVAYVLVLPHYRLIAARRWLVRHYRAALATIAAGLLAALVAATTYATVNNVRFDAVKGYRSFMLGTFNLRTPLDEQFLKFRMEYWKAAVRMVQANPVFGIGVGRYYNDLSRYAAEPERLPKPRENTHNYFLQVAAELGLAGAAAFLALLVAPFRALHRVLRSGAAGADRQLAMGMATGIGAFLAALLTGHSLLLREGQHAFWPLVAAALLLPRAAGLGRSHPTAAAVPASPRWPRARRAAVPIAVAAILLSAVPRALDRASRVNRLAVFVGFNEVKTEPDGYEYRWLDPRATFFVPGDARFVEVPLRSLAPFTQVVEVFVDGRRVDLITLDDHEWHRAQYQLPAATRSGFRKVELRTDQPWQPPGEPGPRGPMIGETRWIRAGQGG